jgi:hypothetical protein
MPFGMPSTKRLAACLAASSRDGDTSVAFMEPEVSIAT